MGFKHCTVLCSGILQRKFRAIECFYGTRIVMVFGEINNTCTQCRNQDLSSGNMSAILQPLQILAAAFYFHFSYLYSIVPNYINPVNAFHLLQKWLQPLLSLFYIINGRLVPLWDDCKEEAIYLEMQISISKPFFDRCKFKLNLNQIIKALSEFQIRKEFNFESPIYLFRAIHLECEIRLPTGVIIVRLDSPSGFADSFNYCSHYFRLRICALVHCAFETLRIGLIMSAISYFLSNQSSINIINIGTFSRTVQLL